MANLLWKTLARVTAAFGLLAAPSAHAQMQLIMTARTSGSSYSLNKTITFDHTKVPSTQTNFPTLVTFTDASFKSTGNGGSITSGSGYDIVFSTGAGCGTPMTYEMTYWDPATGFVEAWVSIASLSSSVDTVIHLCGGNAAITTFRGGAAGAVWAAAGNYTLVSHFSNGTSLSLADSTSGANTGTNSAATAVAGQIDGGIGTDVAKYATFPQSVIAGLTTATFSMWVKTSASSQQEELGSGLGICASNGFGAIQTWPSSGPGIGKQAGLLTDSAEVDDTTHTVVGDGNFHYLVGVYAPTTASIQVDNNTPVVLTGLSNSAIGSSDALDVGSVCSNFSSGGLNFVGTIDELHISTGTRTADWITTEYNNQSAPGTFYSIT